MPAHLLLPRGIARWVPPRPWLVVSPAETPAIDWGGSREPLFLYPAPAGIGDGLVQFASSLPRRAGTVLTAPLLSSTVRAELEARDIGYIDSRGNLHLVLSNGIVHAEAVRRARGASTAGLGVNGVRAVQRILSGDGAFTVSSLSKEAHLSLAHAHKIIRLLEDQGFLRTSTAGAARLRTVTDRAALLDWLASQRVARRQERHLDVALYARRPEDLWTRLDEALSTSGVGHALTGGAAAALLGGGPTAVPTSRIRIDPDVPLERAAQLLGAAATARGANLRLIRDDGRVGTMDAVVKDGVHVAPAVRVYLDALGEKRGEDVATHFREVVLGY